MKKSKELEFVCDHCGSTRLPEEVETSITMTTQLSRIDKDGDHEYDKSIQTMEQNNDSCIWWQCSNCGNSVHDEFGMEIHDCAELGKVISKMLCNRKRGCRRKPNKENSNG